MAWVCPHCGNTGWMREPGTHHLDYCICGIDPKKELKMTHFPEINTALDYIRAAATARGFHKPYAKLEHRNDNSVEIVAYWRLDDSWSANLEYKSIRLTDEVDLEKAVRHLINEIRKAPTIEDQRKETFLKAVANAIDLGREANIDVEFLNPLTAMMKELSENVITDQSDIAE